MKKVFINEFYEFGSLGLHGAISTDQNNTVKTGEIIQDQNGKIFKILSIAFPTRPPWRTILLRLKEQEEL